jgi:ornithine--oxo-acid transaminase
MSLDIERVFAEREAERYALHARYLNEQMVRVLETIGFDQAYRRGEGQYLYDRNGRQYLDLLSGWGVFALGRNHPVVRETLKKVLDANFPNLVQMDVSALAGIMAERLLGYVPHLEKVFFANSGTESVIIYCGHAYHGLTYGSLSVNGDEIFRKGFGSLLPGCTQVPFNDLGALDRALASKSAAAFIAEPIQGKGVTMPADDYLASALALCRKYGTLFIADEIQTGLGRTGRFLACQHWGIEPDIVLLSKSLSGGHVPVGAVLTRKWIFDKVFDRMDRAVVHGSTFAKNDMAMAAGLATLEVLESEKLMQNAERIGARLLATFGGMIERHELVKSVRGKGLMVGIEFGAPRSLTLKASWNLLETANSGLFCQLIVIPLLKNHRILTQVAGHGNHTIKLLPPFIITDADCEWIEKSFAAVIADAHRVPGAIWSLGKTLIENAAKARARG